MNLSSEVAEPVDSSLHQIPCSLDGDTTTCRAQDGLVDQPLALHNSFDLLFLEKDVVSGEALPEYLHTLEVPGAVTDLSKDIPAEVALSEAPPKPVAYASEHDRSPVSRGHSSDKQMRQNVGRVSFPNPSSLSFEQGSIDARVVDSDRLKAWVDTPVLTPMPQPITTSYANLTVDKLPSSQILVLASKSSFHSAAALKSVQILSKFWEDEVEKVEDVMEDTLSHDKRLEMEDFPSLSESTKTEKKKKKQVNKVMPFSFNSAEMRTRAEKSTSKAALTNTE
ncbi:hypothetical protein MtrunA17_Chr1g0163341 [Medicago truncatula]|uniref:Uncharacterized protein n=1 Tax=Medicago truncatula TaxID=3880 RepID=A0A396JJ35_MEDTR|nr:hypothetical protein MtrunA17_Chr1g0163341 [Medicago truncatula]